MHWTVILAPLAIALILALTIGMPPATGGSVEVIHHTEENRMLDAERRAPWRPSISWTIVLIGLIGTIALAAMEWLG